MSKLDIFIWKVVWKHALRMRNATHAATARVLTPFCLFREYLTIFSYFSNIIFNLFYRPNVKVHTVWQTGDTVIQHIFDAWYMRATIEKRLFFYFSIFSKLDNFYEQHLFSTKILLEGPRFTILITHGRKMIQSSIMMIYVSVFVFFF